MVTVYTVLVSLSLFIPALFSPTPHHSLYMYMYMYMYKDYLCFLSDYSMYIYYFSKPWGCFVCICMCVFLLF